MIPPDGGADPMPAGVAALPAPSPALRRVAFVSNNCTGLNSIRGPIVREFIAAGYEVHVVAPRDDFSSVFERLGVRFHALRLEPNGRNPLSELSVVTQLWRLYRAIRPGLIFHYTIKINLYGTQVARALRIPSVAVVPGLGTFPDEPRFPMGWLLRLGYASAARHSEEVWFANQHDHDYFARRGWLRGACPRVLPGEGVDTRAFAHSPLPANPRPRVLFVGRLIAAKGVRTVAAAARRTRDLGLDYGFELLGFEQAAHPDGVGAAELAEWVHEGIIRYHGSTYDVRDYLRDVDIVVLPTYFREGMSCSIQEAMSSGRPVITTAVPGAGELVEDGVTGYIVPPRDPRAIVDAIERHFATSPEERERMSERARAAMVRAYDIAYVHRYYYEVVTRVRAR